MSAYLSVSVRFFLFAYLKKHSFKVDEFFPACVCNPWRFVVELRTRSTQLYESNGGNIGRLVLAKGVRKTLGHERSQFSQCSPGRDTDRLKHVKRGAQRRAVPLHQPQL